MINVKAEGVDATVLAKYCQHLVKAAQLSLNFPASDMIEWFGSATNGTLKSNLERMAGILDDSGRTLTFVNASKKGLKVSYNPDDISEAPKLLDKALTKSEMSGVFGYAFPVKNDCAGKDNPLFHVGSGMRIYLGPQFFSTGDNWERLQTVYHELTHKVLGTNDHEYGPKACRELATLDPQKAMINADNYGYFVTSLLGKTW